MDRQALLEQAIRTLARRAGIERPVFHVLCVSQDSAGIFIMQTTWPDGRAICEAITRVVETVPKDHYTTCIALLPELVDAIILAARPAESADEVWEGRADPP
jgi:hypothetical protein